MLHKLATFHHSVYIEACCENLAKANACPTDRYIPAITQLQHILEKIDRISVRNSHGFREPDQSIELQVMGLKSELEAFKEKLPFAMWDSGKWLLPRAFMSMALSNVIIQNYLACNSMPPNSVSIRSAYLTDIWHLLQAFSLLLHQVGAFRAYFWASWQLSHCLDTS